MQNPWDLALTDEAVVISEMNAGRLVQVSKEGGPLLILAEGFRATATVATYGADIAFLAVDPSPEVTAPTDLHALVGGRDVRLARSDVSEGRIAMGAGFVVWPLGHEERSIMFVSTTGLDAPVLIEDAPRPFAATVAPEAAWSTGRTSKTGTSRRRTCVTRNEARG